jgi:hypothetical protein
MLKLQFKNFKKFRQQKKWQRFIKLILIAFKNITSLKISALVITEKRINCLIGYSFISL